MNDSVRESSAFVLDCRDFHETSQLLVLLTETNGRVDAVARGSRRTKGSIPDRFCKVFVVWRSPRKSGLATIVRWELEESYPVLRSSYLAYLLASLWAESVLALAAPSAEELDVFRVSAQFLNSFQREEPRNLPRRKHLRLFWQLLESLGYVGGLENCANCMAKGPLHWFSFSGMGPVCEQCALGQQDVYPISKTLVSYLGPAGERALDLPVGVVIAANFFHFYGTIVERIAEKKLPSLPLLEKALHRDS